MKLGEVARHVIDFLRSHPNQEYTANTLLMHLGLPLREKRRLYDVIEVLSCTGQVGLRKVARKRYFRWKPEITSESTEMVKIDLPADPTFQEAGTVIHLLLQFGTHAFQEFSNITALKMVERDIKRTILGANAVSVVQVSLKNEQGRVLKQATMSHLVPATAL